MKKDPNERLTAAQALEHAWFKKEFTEENVLELSKLKIRDVVNEEKSAAGGAAEKLLITCTPVMAGRKLQNLPPPSPFLTAGGVSHDNTPIIQKVSIQHVGEK